MSRTEQFTAIVVAISTVLLFDHFHLIPASYEAGRVTATVIAALGGLIVILVWPFVFGKKKKNGPDDES